ncbi:MAG: hypothetical protein ACPG77_06225 [Nannocystaceae bacterium]
MCKDPDERFQSACAKDPEERLKGARDMLEMMSLMPSNKDGARIGLG